MNQTTESIATLDARFAVSRRRSRRLPHVGADVRRCAPPLPYGVWLWSPASRFCRACHSSPTAFATSKVPGTRASPVKKVSECRSSAHQKDGGPRNLLPSRHRQHSTILDQRFTAAATARTADLWSTVVQLEGVCCAARAQTIDLHRKIGGAARFEPGMEVLQVRLIPRKSQQDAIFQGFPPVRPEPSGGQTGVSGGEPGTTSGTIFDSASRSLRGSRRGRTGQGSCSPARCASASPRAA